MACRNCTKQKKDEVLSTGQLPITNVILGCAKDPNTPNLGSMDPEEVESYLEKNLTWKAMTVTESVFVTEVSYSTRSPSLITRNCSVGLRYSETLPAQR